MYKSRIPQIINQVHDAAMQAIEESAQLIYNESQLRVPLDDGELIASGKVEREEDTIYIHYGSDDISSQYAVIQHEDLTLRHAPGRAAKYLQTPFNAHIPATIQSVADALARIL